MITLLILLEPAFDDETPWWAVWWYWVILAAIPVVTILVTRSNQKRELAAAHEVVRKVDEQVSNNHETNLRDDLDDTKEMASNAASDASLAKESAHRTERAVKDLILTIRASEHSADRKYGILNDKIKEIEGDLVQHLEDVPNILAEWERNHTASCAPRIKETE